MKHLRTAAIALGIVLALGMGLWLVDFILRVQAALVLLSPWLARGFLVLVGLGAIVAVGAAIYYGRLFLRPRRDRPTPTLPTDTVAAAEVALGAVEQQVSQIQDQVAREALAAKARELGEGFAQRDIRVVVFGVGSVGKTALVNRLLGQAVGDVAAPMGSTTIAATYPLRLPGVDQTLWLTDTPGLLEASAEGTGREAQVRELATAADIVLFVIDNDLRQSEYALARSLLALGKRLLVVFNKVDLYPENDLAAILARVRSRFGDSLAPQDVVDVAAAPQPIALAEGGTAQMEPDLWPLQQRLTAVLRAEGATLMAETLLLNSQRLGAEARQVLERQRQIQATAIVERYQWLNAGVVAATPLPVVDLLATAAINAQMVVELGRVYRCDLSIEEGKALAKALVRTLGSLGLVKGAMNLLAVGMQANLATAIASRAVQGASAAFLTRVAGNSFITYFQQNQDWGDGGIGAVVEQQFQLSRREASMRAFVQAAIDHLPDLPPM
jgi:small GTP-binding protein